ncbi:MAG: signal recognition particle-docking protein FtsY [Vicinamibacteria bacterium]|jgi:fused signal recognition particle receptor|nr:signal recognition particle-docking protein FtsY [Vicinamibacteria bacterium]
MALLDRLKQGLSRTRRVLETPVEDLLRGRRVLEPADLDAMEEALIAADLGMPAVAHAMEMLRARSRDIAEGGAPAMRALLCEEFRQALTPLAPAPAFTSRPWVVFVTGVNGAGKTTSIGKLAAAWKAEGRSVLVCAADTFRAAAAEQLEVWAGRTGAAFHRGPEGSDPSSVLTDAIRMAKARGIDAVLVDTAGRLHTKGNLMAELAKMVRVAGRELPGAPHETLLVLDATVGSNGLAQGREFARAAGVTGLVLTKLDGTAKGGVAVAVVRDLGVPIRYVGVGEAVEDLLPFDAGAFAESLIGDRG